MVDGHGVLLVGVPALEAWVRARTAQQDASFVSDDPAFAHAHITILAPVGVDETVREAGARIAAAASPFSYTLAHVAEFPDGCIHLRPEPDAGFRALTDAARALLPDVVPYWGWHDPVPHLTLDRSWGGVTRAATAEAVAPLLPAACVADAVLLTWWQSGACHVVERWPLGGPGWGQPVESGASSPGGGTLPPP